MSLLSPARPTVLSALSGRFVGTRSTHQTGRTRGVAVVITTSIGSVVGFDDFRIATQSFPTLTTLHSPIRTIGLRAAQKLFERTAEHQATGRAAADQSVPAPELAVRQSSGAAPVY